jgi:hypothetical protein
MASVLEAATGKTKSLFRAPRRAAARPDVLAAIRRLF